MDRGYLDYSRLYRIHLAGGFFVTRPRATSTPAASTPARPTSKPASLLISPLPSTDMEVARIIPATCAASASATLTLASTLSSSPTSSPCRHHHLRSLQMPLADRTVLQVDQATPAHQGLRRNQRKRGKNPNLDRRLGLPAGRHRQETTRSPRLALHFAASHLSYLVRENAHFTGTSAEELHKSAAN